jgi:hypothetical protein
MASSSLGKPMACIDSLSATYGLGLTLFGTNAWPWKRDANACSKHCGNRGTRFGDAFQFQLSLSSFRESTMTSHIKPVATTEYDAVVQAAQAYIDGYRAGDILGIERAFHQEAVMWGYSGDELLQGPAVPAFASFFKALGASPNTRSRLDILAIAPTAAVVRVDMEDDVVGASFNDYLSLLKIGGQWKIISKVFQRYA